MLTFACPMQRGLEVNLQQGAATVHALNLPIHLTLGALLGLTLLLTLGYSARRKFVRPWA
jgi:hypothetical protein